MAISLITAGCTDAVRAPSTGGIAVEIDGLPGGVHGQVSISGPSDYRVTLASSRALTDLMPGDYTVVAADVSGNNARFGADVERQVVTVSAGSSQRIRLQYLDINTALRVQIRGLPEGAQPLLRVIGPGGFDRAVMRTERLLGLAEGMYTILGTGVVSGDSTYQPNPVRRELYMTGTFPGDLTVTYSAAGTRALNLRISGLYLLNTVQTPTGTIPLVAGKSAFLRVFATASEANAASPWVRVRFYHGNSVVRTFELPPGSSSMPNVLEEGALERSWNVMIPAELVVPGLRVDALVDPDGAIIEADESDNLFPASGVPLDVPVVSMPPLRVRFVPVAHVATGTPGGVTMANMGSYLRMTRKLFPVPDQIEADVRSLYTTSGPVLESSGAGWVPLLNEIAALRVAENGAGVHYMGIVRTGYTRGVAGMAFVPGRPVLGGAGLAWDYLPSGSEVVAHELGHNFGRLHAPCGVDGDPEYPFAGGRTGIFGYDIEMRVLKTPDDPDVMGYCENPWISQHTYDAIWQFRAAAAARPTSSGPQSTILVWGRMGDDGLVLEPAFHVTARPALPSSDGPFLLQGFDRAGTALFSISFAGEPVAHAKPSERVFAFAVPVPVAQVDRLATLRLSGQGRETTIRADADGEPVVQSLTAQPQAGRVELRWDARSHPVALVRDAATGEILAFARGGRVSLPAPRGGALDVHVSNGVRSASRRVPIQPN